MYKKILLFVIILHLFSCRHFSGELNLSEAEKEECISENQRLSKSKGLQKADETDVLLYRNWQYTGLWNNLASWKMSQDLFEKVCTDYLKIDSTRIKTIEHDRAGKLEHYLKNYSGQRLIIYFVSHQTSKGQIVLNNGNYYPTKRFAALLNNLKCETLLIFETCYAEKLKKYLKNDKVSVYYAASNSKEAYDFRPRGQKPSLNEMCRETEEFIKGAWEIDLKSVSPFGFYFIKAMREESYQGIELGSLINLIISYNRKMIGITGLGRYPKVSWEDPAGWGKLKARQ
jgi:hypothetical protein